MLPMTIAATVFAQNRGTVAISRGPLTYSLKIGERWAPYENGKKWAAFEVFPTTPWNYGLLVDVNNPGKDIEVVKSNDPIASQPFTPDAAPVALKAKGKRLPGWTLETNGLIGEAPQSPADSDQPTEEITLIPMGCAPARLSAFPTIQQ